MTGRGRDEPFNPNAEERESLGAWQLLTRRLFVITRCLFVITRCLVVLSFPCCSTATGVRGGTTFADLRVHVGTASRLGKDGVHCHAGGERPGVLPHLPCQQHLRRWLKEEEWA